MARSKPSLAGPGTLDAAFTSSRDGCRIAYWAGGNPAGLPVVLLHGFALDHTVWAPVWQQPGFLAQCYVVAPDLRGHGSSGRPAADSYANSRHWADDLDAVIRSSGVDRPVVAAWSYSGRMVFDYIRHYGSASLRCVNLVAAASLADPSVLGPCHGYLAGLCSADPHAEAAASQQFLREVLKIDPASQQFAALLNVLRQTTAEQRGWLRSRPLDYDALIASLALPVLVTHGALDPVLLPAHADNLQRAIPHALISHYGLAGHAPFIDDPERFGNELIDFAEQAACGN